MEQQGTDNSAGESQLWSSVGKSASLCNFGGAQKSSHLFFLLSGLVNVLKRVSSAISVKRVGSFPSVIQVLQYQLIQWAGKCSPRQWRLVSCWPNLQPIPWPCGYTAAKGAHSYEQVTEFQNSPNVLHGKHAVCECYCNVRLCISFFYPPSHHIEKRKCNTATCVTQRLADFLVRSSNTIGTVYAPTNVGSATYGKRDLLQPPIYLPL